MGYAIYTLMIVWVVYKLRLCTPSVLFVILSFHLALLLPWSALTSTSPLFPRKSPAGTTPLLLFLLQLLFLAAVPWVAPATPALPTAAVRAAGEATAVVLVEARAAAAAIPSGSAPSPC